MNTDVILLIPETPGSLCPLINSCPIRKFSSCTRAESAKCGLLPKKEDVSYIRRALARSLYWRMPFSYRVAFIKSTFGVNVDECEVDYRQHIANIIRARILLPK